MTAENSSFQGSGKTTSAGVSAATLTESPEAAEIVVARGPGREVTTAAEYTIMQQLEVISENTAPKPDRHSLLLVVFTATLVVLTLALVVLTAALVLHQYAPMLVWLFEAHRS